MFNHKHFFFPRDLQDARKRAGLDHAQLERAIGLKRGVVFYLETQFELVNGSTVLAVVKALEGAGHPVKPVGHGLSKAEADAIYRDMRKACYEQLGRCNAKTRKGTLCKAKPIPGSKRCRNHGGLSTGPKTRTGIESIRRAQIRRWAKAKQV